ncbi:gag-pol polyprotein [Tanacetum coccineum]
MPSWKPVAERTIPVVECSSETTTEGYMENYKNVSEDIRNLLNAEAEVVHIIFTRIDNDIYCMVDACPNAIEMWKSIEMLKQGESINVQDLETKWQKFVTLVKQSQELKTVSYHKLYDILKEHQNKVNEIRAERLTHTANLLALVAQQQLETEIDKLMALISLSFKKIYKPTNNNLKTSSNTSRANQDNNPRTNRGSGYDNQRAVNVVGAREKLGTQVVQQSRIQCYNFKELGHVEREFDWRDDTDDEPDDQELEAYYLYMAKIQEVTPYTAENFGPIFNAEPLQKVQHNDDYNVFAMEKEHLNQPESVNDTYLADQERDLLASLIKKPKCEIDEIKNRNKLLETSNQTLVNKLKSEIEDFKIKNKCLESSNNHFKEANTELAKNNQLMFKDLKKFQAELDRYHDVNYASKVEIERAKAKGELISHKMSSESCYNDNLALMLALESDKTIRLSQEGRSKLNRLSREYYYADHMNAILDVYTKLDEVTDLQCDYLDQKQHQNEVNEIRAERLARIANPLTLVAQQQPVYHSQPHPAHYTQNSSTRSQQAATRNRVTKDDALSKEKEIDKMMALISLSFNKIYKPTSNNLKTSSNTSRANQDNNPRTNRGTGYDNQRVVNVVGARKNVGTQVVQQSMIQCFNCKELGHVARECQKPKWAKDANYHKEKMLLCKEEEAGIQLSAEHVDWRDDTHDEPEDQKSEAYYLYMAKIQEVTPDAAENSGPIFDAEPLQKVQHNDDYNVFAMEIEHLDQPESVNDTYLADQEHDFLSSLIKKLKCEIDESKNRNKLLETSNQTLVNKLKSEIEDFKNKNKCLESSNNHFKEANTELAKINQLMFKDLKRFQAELDRYHDVNYASKVEIECAKAKGELISHKMSSEKSFNEYTRKINDLNQTILEMKEELIAHQETISIMSQEKEAQKNDITNHKENRQKLGKQRTQTESEQNLEAKAEKSNLQSTPVNLEAEKDKEILRLKATPPEFSSFFRGQFQGLVWNFLASDEFSRVQGELLSLAASAGFERELSMHQTKDEFVVLEPEKLAHPANVPTLRDACISPPIAKESTVTPASKSLEFSTNVAPAPFAVALEQNEEWGTSHVLDDVAEVRVVGSERVSSGLTDVVVALSAGEKGDGSLPSSAVDEEAATNPSRV